MINSRDINTLRDDVRVNCEALIAECAKQGLSVCITSTLRDQEYQTKLWNQGRTTAGNIVTQAKLIGFHGYGLAFDFCKNVKGHEYDDLAFFVSVAAIAKRMGFSWGGDWKTFVDRPHIQWDNHGNLTAAQLRAGIVAPKMPKFEEMIELTKYNSISELPEWARPTIRKLVNNSFLKGTDTGLDVSDDFVRIMVVLDRIGLIPD